MFDDVDVDLDDTMATVAGMTVADIKKIAQITNALRPEKTDDEEAVDEMTHVFDKLIDASSTLAGFQAFIVTMYHQGETAFDGNGRELNINNTLTKQTKRASLYLFIAFAANLAVMVLSLFCEVRVQKEMAVWQWKLLKCMELILRYAFGFGVILFFLAMYELVQNMLLDEYEENVEQALVVIGALTIGLWFGVAIPWQQTCFAKKDLTEDPKKKKALPLKSTRC